MAKFFDGTLTRALSRVFAATNSERSAHSAVELEALLRGEGSGVTEGSALRVAAVYACVSLLSRSQAMLPLQLFVRDGARRKLALEHPAAALLMGAPNRWQTPFDFEAMMVAHKHLRGNAYAFISELNGKVQELIPLNPARMRVVQRDDLTLDYVYKRRDGRERVYAQSEIHHRRGLCTDGVMGLSPLEAARRAIGLAIDMEAHGQKMFQNAAKPSGALKSPKPLTPEAAARLKSSFEAAHAGSENAYKTMVLEDGLEWVQIGMSSEDLQFIEGRKLQRSEIAMFFAVPPHMIGDIERGTSWGSGIEQQSLGFLVHTLNPHLVNDRQALMRDLIRGKDAAKYLISHDTSILTRAEFSTRQNGLEIQKRNGVINANEWREIEGLNPREDGKGDDYSVASDAKPAQSQSSKGPVETPASARN